LVVLVTVLTACGGGGGGSSSISYQGATAKAVINDAATATDLSEVAYYGSQVDDIVPSVASLQGGPQGSATATPAPVIQKLAQLVSELPGREEFASTVTGIAAVSFSDPPEECYVSGTATYSGTVNETTGAMKITARFSSCDDGEGYIANGSMTLDMDGDLTSLVVDLNQFSMEFVAEQEKITIDGVVRASVDEVAGTESLSMSLVMRDDLSGEMAKLEDYTVVVTDATYVEISGRVYSSEVGYVDLSTVQTIELNIWGEPVAGIYRIDGDAGTWAEYDFSTALGTFGDTDGPKGTFNLTSD
ncbi:MAG TPA: hypothetical protein VGA63_11095, partial [Geopsychrobacteraceae bacterium]